MDRARRHFGMLKGDACPLVAAMASERDFWCEYVENQFRPPIVRNESAITQPPIPQHAMVWLRFMLKSLSVRIKSVAAQDRVAIMLAKMW